MTVMCFLVSCPATSLLGRAPLFVCARVLNSMYQPLPTLLAGRGICAVRRITSLFPFKFLCFNPLPPARDVVGEWFWFWSSMRLCVRCRFLLQSRILYDERKGRERKVRAVVFLPIAD